MRLVLFQPDIPQNCGALMRLAACMGLGLDIVEPCGFIWDEARLKRSAMDYRDKVALTRHSSWATFQQLRKEQGGRLVLLTTQASQAYCDFTFAGDDWLMLGRESAGVPQEVHEAADCRITIPMAAGLRSINVAQAGAMLVGEALRQTKGFAPQPPTWA